MPSRRRRARARILLVACALGASTLTPAPARADEPQRAILRLSVNQVDKGEVMVLVKDSDVLVGAPDLEQAGLRVGGAGRREARDGGALVSLASLAPRLTFALDRSTLTLALTADPELLAARTALDLQPGAPPGLTFRSDPAAFLNYAGSTVDFRTFTLSGELGISVKGALFLTSATRNEDGSLVRGLTSLTYDDRARLMRWVAGDQVVSSLNLGGGVVLAGLGVSREFSIDPYFVRFPTVGLAGAVATPSTADIYVNGHLVRTESIAPGTFELRNLPVYGGRGVARVVIRDAFGREQELTAPYYFTTALLGAGMQEYSYNAGFRRENLPTESWDYGRPTFMGRHRLGITDWVTLGARLELDPRVASGGPVLTARLPLGEAELGLAASRDGDRAGVAASLGYNYVGRPLSVGGSLRVLSDHYATLSLGADEDRPQLEGHAFVGLQLGPRVNVTAQYAYADFRDRGVEERIALLTTVRLTDRASLYLNGSHAWSRLTGAVNEGFAGVTYFFGAATTGTVGYEQRGHAGQGTVEVQKSLPVGSGFGYRVRGAAGDEPQGLAVLQYQGDYGRYEAGYQNTDGRSLTTASVAGGLMAIGGSLFATRPVYDSFGLIRVPGVAGVHGYVNNQDIGTTNARGDLPVPNMLAYYGNRVAIADTDVPLDFTVGAVERTVAPSLRGGAVVEFPVKRVRSVSGRVVVERGGVERVPAYGDLRVSVDGARFESPIGRDGEFYLENLPAGRHLAVIDDRDGRCTFSLDTPVVGLSVVDLGTLRCAADAAR